MLFDDNRISHRQQFFDAWRKYDNKEPLDPLQKKLVHLILQHPEYQKMFQNPDHYQDKDYLPELGESNPFLHLGLHLTILEQVSINQPKGMTKLYKQCIERFGDSHDAEHCLMNSLAIGLSELQSSEKGFDEKGYVKRIKKALRDGRW